MLSSRIMELKKNNGSEMNHGFAKEKNYGYSIKIYKIIMNYGIEKKILGFRQIMDLQKKKNNGYSIKIYKII